jgi:hypothetical protein
MYSGTEKLTKEKMMLLAKATKKKMAETVRTFVDVLGKSKLIPIVKSSVIATNIKLPTLRSNLFSLS